MDIKNQIQTITIKEILDKVGVRYKEIQGTLHLYEDWKVTWWWKAKWSFVTDFSKWRPQWDQIAFVSSYLNIDFKDTLKWFKNNFNLIDSMTVTQLPKLKEKEKHKWKEYLKKRWIDYDRVAWLVKFADIKWRECIVMDMKRDWHIVGRQARSIGDKWFFSEGTDWFFFTQHNNKKDRIYIVEWMTDYLSLRQFIPNVIWLKSSNTSLPDKMIDYLNSFKQVFLLIDNDEAWKKAKDKIIPLLFNQISEIVWDEKIDMNDLLLELWEDLIEWIDNIIEITKRPEFEIVDYSETLESWLKELEATNPKDAISWGYKELDDKLWYIYPWQLIVVGGSSGSWKTTFVWEIAKNISKQWNRVLKFTLEDRLQDRKKQDIYYEICRIRMASGLKSYPYNDFMSNEIVWILLAEEKKTAIKNLLRDNINIKEIVRNNEKQIDITNLDKIIKEWIAMWCRTIILDHLQEFKIEWNKERQDLRIEETMYAIKNISRRYNIAIILIAHFKKIEWRPNENSFKDSISIVQVANKVILIHRDKLNPESITELIIAKNRERPNWTWIIEMNFNLDELRYTNIKSKKQKTMEEFNF